MSTPDLSQIMEQAKEMQKKMQNIQNQLADTEVVGESGGGLVKITMTCRHEVRKLFIADETWKEDREIFSELIIAAFNDAIRKSERESKHKISSLTKEMGLPDNL
jgi:DNA-binding YbaB/EbfC family protein